MTNFLYQGDLPDDLKFSNSVAIDVETMGLKNGRDRLCLIQLSGGDGDAHLVQFKKDSYDQAFNLKKLLSDPTILKIFHFARFDLATLQAYLHTPINNIYCTKIASKLSRTYTEYHGLKSLALELLNIELSKKQQSSDWGNETISKEQIKYAADDVLYLHKIREKLDVMLMREGRRELAQKCFEFLTVRAELDLAGFEEDIFAH